MPACLQCHRTHGVVVVCIYVYGFSERFSYVLIAIRASVSEHNYVESISLISVSTSMRVYRQPASWFD